MRVIGGNGEHGKSELAGHLSRFVEDVMSRYFSPLMVVGVGLLVVLGGLGFVYATARIGLSTFVFLTVLALALCAVAVVFARQMSDPPGSVRQVQYKTDHPTGT